MTVLTAYKDLTKDEKFEQMYYEKKEEVQKLEKQIRTDWTTRTLYDSKQAETKKNMQCMLESFSQTVERLLVFIDDLQTENKNLKSKMPQY